MPGSNKQKTIRFAYGQLILTFNVKKQPSVSKTNRFFLQEPAINLFTVLTGEFKPPKIIQTDFKET